MFAIRADREYVVEEDFFKAARKLLDAKKLEGRFFLNLLFSSFLCGFFFFSYSISCRACIRILSFQSDPCLCLPFICRQIGLHESLKRDDCSLAMAVELTIQTLNWPSELGAVLCNLRAML